MQLLAGQWKIWRVLSMQHVLKDFTGNTNIKCQDLMSIDQKALWLTNCAQEEGATSVS